MLEADGAVQSNGGMPPKVWYCVLQSFVEVTLCWRSLADALLLGAGVPADLPEDDLFLGHCRNVLDDVTKRPLTKESAELAWAEIQAAL